MSHGVEGEKIVFSDAVCFAKEFEAGFEDSGFGVLEWNADAKHGSTVLMIEIDTLRNFSSCDAKENCAAAVAACCAVRF